jgi:hypothetical protein
MLLAGRTPNQIFAAWQDEVESFGAVRAKYLLY